MVFAVQCLGTLQQPRKELVEPYYRVARELDMHEVEDCMALHSRADGLFLHDAGGYGSNPAPSPNCWVLQPLSPGTIIRTR